MSHAGSSSSFTPADAPLPGSRRAPTRYALAIGIFLIAAATTIWLWDEFFVQVPFALFFAAVMLTAWWRRSVPDCGGDRRIADDRRWLLSGPGGRSC